MRSSYPSLPVEHRKMFGYVGVYFFFSFCAPLCVSYKIVGTFSSAQIDLRKTRERELTTLDEISSSSEIAEPYAR